MQQLHTYVINYKSNSICIRTLPSIVLSTMISLNNPKQEAVFISSKYTYVQAWRHKNNIRELVDASCRDDAHMPIECVKKHNGSVAIFNAFTGLGDEKIYEPYAGE